MATHADTTTRWRIDPTIPLALVVAIGVQTLVGTWWMSSFQAQTVSKLDNLEVRQKAMDLLPERMAKQEAQIEAVTAMLKEIRSDMRDFTNRGAHK
jgi:uncharacterized membrane protein